MANSVVKVHDIKDEEPDDSLLLLVGEDGTVIPDQDTVETFLKQRNGPTNIQIMKINRSEKQAIDITVDNVTYMPDIISEEIVKTEEEMDEVARNLYNIKLDHDYTSLTWNRSMEDDELMKTLSILDGPEHVIPLSSSEPPPLIMTSPQKIIKQPPKIKLIQSITLTPPTKGIRKPIVTPSPEQTQLPPKPIVILPQPDISSCKVPVSVDNTVKIVETVELKKSEPPKQPQIQSTPVIDVSPKVDRSNLAESSTSQTPVKTPTAKPKAKIIKTQTKPRAKVKKPQTPKVKAAKEVIEEESEVEFEEDFLDSVDEDDDDSDFNFEEEIKTKQPTRRISRRTKSETQVTPARIQNRSKSRSNITLAETPAKPEQKMEQKVESKMEVTQEKVEEKQPLAKDVITEQKPDKVESKQPEKKPPPKKKKEIPKQILDDFALFSTPDIIRRVGGKDGLKEAVQDSEAPGKPAKISDVNRSRSGEHLLSPTRSRNSVDSSKIEKEKDKEHKDNKHKERRVSNSEIAPRHSVEEKNTKTKENKSEKAPNPTKSVNTLESILNTDHKPSAEDIRSIIMNEETKSFTTGSILIAGDIPNDSQNLDPNSINLDASGLDLDPSLLDNLNNDELSEDILYQVAQSLVSNPELQNAIDKGINEGVLDPMGVHQNVMDNQSFTEQKSEDVSQKGTQIVRPDGRIVVIPPIERPTTRSRNKKKEESKPIQKPVHKPLDNEHVSGNELDSSNDEEDESEDDPNKLWCICNQPHNNRFMICCDTCEEWYHGKCVNITKVMGQQMEAEGKEWICVYCKDPKLRRPQAAARRVRKASRNSRTSTDSGSSASKSSSNAVPCVVCQKQARKNSIYCSEGCILVHAQGIERVVVFERATGKMLTGNKAPSAANLDQWLKEHPGYEVLRSGGKVVTAKPSGTMTQTKLKLIKNKNDEGVSVMVQNKGRKVGLLKHTPLKTASDLEQPETPKKSPKVIPPAPRSNPQVKEPKTKLIQPQPMKQLVPTTPIAKPKKVEPPPTPKTPVPPPKPKETKPVKEKTPKTPKNKPKEEPITPSPRQPENIRENVKKTVFEQLTNRLKGAGDIKLTEDEVKNISTEIESQLFKYFGDTGQKYRNKYRSLIFNIKDAKNQTLWRRICEKSINPYDLVRLSPDDLASQELAMWREREAKHQLDMIKKSELELLNCNRQYVLKTHKGEQVVEDDRTDRVDNTEVIKSLTEGGSTLNSDDAKHDVSKDKDKKSSSKHKEKDRSRDRDRGRKSNRDRIHKSRRSSSRERDRRRSRSRDRKHSDHKIQSRSKERDRSRHRKSSHKSTKHRKDIISTTEKLDKKAKEILEQLVDNKIVPPLDNRLWKHVPQDDIFPAPESDSDHEPSSTVTIPTPPRTLEEDLPIPDTNDGPLSPTQENSAEPERSTSPPPKTKPIEIWRGVINMIDVAQISITAHEVSGDCSGLTRELSGNLDIVGRISPDTVWEYISKMKCSNSKGISLIRLNATNIEEKMPYLALYSYLSSRDRLGVVKSLNKAVKDFYIYPLAPQKPIPQVLLPLHGPGFEESRPALLLGIIVRDKRKRPTVDTSNMPTLPPKKPKLDHLPLPSSGSMTPPIQPTRSYTPPPMKDIKMKLPPLLPPVLPAPSKDEDDEPYSPVDSSPENGPSTLFEPPPPPIVPTTIPEAIPNYSAIPALPSSALELQRQMEELNKKIEMQKSEITSMTQNIVSASSEIGTSALANIALPSNLQQILDSIKTIGETSENPQPKEPSEPDLTIPLMIPKTYTPRSLVPPVLPDMPSDTIPLKLPSKPKIKPPSVNSPLLEERSGGVLSSLTEEDLIKKAAEMLGETESTNKRIDRDSFHSVAKRTKIDIKLPPVPGMED